MSRGSAGGGQAEPTTTWISAAEISAGTEQLRARLLDIVLLALGVCGATGSAFVVSILYALTILVRGWTFGDRLTAFGELVPLPPLSSLAPDGVFSFGS